MKDHAPEIHLDKKAIGAFLRSKRNERNMTQQEVASFCSISLDTYKKWEQGARIPSLAEVIKLAQLYQISMEDLLQLDPDALKSSSKTQIEKSNKPENSADTTVISANQKKDDSDCFTNDDGSKREAQRKSKTVKSGLVLVIAGLTTMLLVLIVFVAAILHLQNMATEDYHNTMIETFINQSELESGETIYNEAQ